MVDQFQLLMVISPRINELSHEKKPWLLRVYRGLYYPVIQGLQ